LFFEFSINEVIKKIKDKRKKIKVIKRYNFSSIKGRFANGNRKDKREKIKDKSIQEVIEQHANAKRKTRNIPPLQVLPNSATSQLCLRLRSGSGFLINTNSQLPLPTLNFLLPTSYSQLPTPNSQLPTSSPPPTSSHSQTPPSTVLPHPFSFLPDKFRIAMGNRHAQYEASWPGVVRHPSR
jgi:hypothetical protein